MQQRWNGLVDITYNVDRDFVDDAGKPVPLMLEFSGYDALRETEIPMTTLSGDGVDNAVVNGGPYTVTWNSLEDMPNYGTENFRVNVKAYMSGNQGAKVSSVKINGGTTLDGAGTTTFRILVNWSNGTQTIVKPVWSITSGGEFASVDSATGVVTSNNPNNSDQYVELTATCEIDGTTYSDKVELTILGQSAYLVVDLTNGSYRYTNALPDVSTDTCRTTELWLRRIEAGSFVMGSPDNECGRYSNEAMHQVTLNQDYYIGVFELTQRQWELVMGEGNRPSFCSQNETYATRPVECVSYVMIRGTGSSTGAGWPNYGHKFDSKSFMGTLKQKTGLIFDLPTEAQWEYACRGGKSTGLNSGEDPVSEGEDASMDVVGRYWNNGGSRYSQTCDASSGTAVVGSYLPNDFGLYDMHGNAWEWCLDWYSENLGTAAVIDPVGEKSGKYRVLRGGSWLVGTQDCRSATRAYNISGCTGFYGLRVVYNVLE
ncbi:MAG: formylglycine-generating enzyme family protein [Lentisphaeria bacterium]|nr:formylglycine-generating enzyme family protein [Lentisphaeria bacterium]